MLTLKFKSYETAHRFGGAFSYQFGHQVRIAAGVSYIFEGHNVPKAFEAHFDFNVEF